MNEILLTDCPMCEATDSLSLVKEPMVVNRGALCIVENTEGWQCGKCKEMIYGPQHITRNHNLVNNAYEVLRSEAFEVLRRIAERGLMYAQQEGHDGKAYIDTFQHLLDEINRAKKIGVVQR